MRKPALAAALIAVTFALAACSSSPMDDTTDDAAPESSQEAGDQGMEDEGMQDEGDAAMALMGSFEGLNDKQVTGTVEVTTDEIVLSEFSSDEGPDLHVYLTNGTDEAAVAEGVEIDVVAFDEASQTFALDGVAIEDYDTVVIHCDAASAVFGAAPLS